MALFPPKNPVPTPTPVHNAGRHQTEHVAPRRTSTGRNSSARASAARFAQTLVGQDNLRESLITTLVAGGHILIESVPGLAKTTAAQTLATSVSGSFKTSAMHA